MTKKIKISQISDIHWRGSSRLEEYTKAFERLFELLKEEKPDLILCTGDIFHTKTQNITPEIVDKMVWMFQKLMEIAPVRTILGNHDGSLANTSRQDVISPIVRAINAAPQLLLYKDSGNFTDPHFPNINWCVFSCFDKDHWDTVQTDSTKTNIALFHGSISGCQTDGGYRMTTGEENLSFFTEFDFVLMGDIHKMQFMAERPDSTGKDKPWIGYPGSLIQQNFGEDVTKGYLTWEIEDKTMWNVSFTEVENYQPFLTIPWMTDLTETLAKVREITKEQYWPGARYRFTSQKNISDVEQRQMQEFLKGEKKAEEVVFKIDVASNLEDIQTNSVKVQKASLRNNPSVLVEMYNDYISNNKAAHPLTKVQQEQASKIIESYLVKFNEQEGDEMTRDVNWSLKSMEFDNIYRYGEGNSIDFSKLNGIVGLFAPNKTGKSSVVGTMMYSLFNTTDRGPIKTAHIINRNSTACRVRTHLDINGTDYVLERTSQKDEPKKKSKSKDIDNEKSSTTLTITKVIPDGTSVPITGISRDDSDKELRKLIGTSEDFLLTSFASQGDMERFIREGATERKNILSRFLDLDIFKKLADFSKVDCSELNVKTKRYTDVQWENLIEASTKEIQTLSATKVVLESRISEKNTEIDHIKSFLLTKEKEFDIATINDLTRQISLKEKLIEGLQAQDIVLTEQIKQKLSELTEINIALQGLNVEDLEARSSNLLKVRDKLSDLETTFKVQRNTLEHQEKSVKKLDVVPCGDSFPNCHYIKDSHENKGLLQEQRKLVESLGRDYEELKVSMDELLGQKISESLRFHRSLTEKKVRAESVLAGLRSQQINSKLLTTIAEREDLKVKLSRLKSAISEDTEVTLDVKRRLLASLKEELQGFESQRSSALVTLGSTSQKLEQHLKEKEECSQILSDLQVYESVYKAFSKNGIPAMILKSQLPAINHELNKILSSVVDFKITLETETSSNVMDVFIEDETSRRVIETASGMEKMIASLAIRVVLTKLTNVPKSDMFILDEAFGPLDDASIHQCLQLMNLLKSYYRLILVITHIAPIKEVADKLIEIKADKMYSYITA